MSTSPCPHSGATDEMAVASLAPELIGVVSPANGCDNFGGPPY